MSTSGGHRGPLVALLATLAAACSPQAPQATELAHFPIDSLDEVLTRSGIAFDPDVSSDGNGSLRVDAEGPVTVRLVETGDLDVENAQLFYRARVRTQDVEGRVYLEMWCQFPGLGEFFSRDLATPLTGTTEWTTEETPFLLQPGQNPDNVKLNVVVDGTGTVWMDDLRLLRGPLP